MFFWFYNNLIEIYTYIISTFLRLICIAAWWLRIILKWNHRSLFIFFRLLNLTFKILKFPWIKSYSFFCVCLIYRCLGFFLIWYNWILSLCIGHIWNCLIRIRYTSHKTKSYIRLSLLYLILRIYLLIRMRGSILIGLILWLITKVLYYLWHTSLMNWAS